MTDYEQIVQTINLYGLAIDAQRWPLLDRVFTTDCDLDYGSGASWNNLAQLKTEFEAFHAPFDVTQHLMTNHLVTITGLEAASLTYGTWRLVRHAAPGDPVWSGTGWYEDKWVKTEAGWRIAKRVCRILWLMGNEKVKETLPGLVFEDERTTPRAEANAGRLAFLDSLT